MSDIQWVQDLPPDAVISGSGQAPGRYAPLARALRDKPQAWAKLPAEPKTEGSAKNLASNIRRGEMKGFAPRGAYETAVAGLEVYVRYVGAPAPQDAPQAEEGDTEGEPGTEKTGPTGAEVRQWAKDQGLNPKPGRLPAVLWAMYREAHGVPPEEE
jgi:hypothetical protein